MEFIFVAVLVVLPLAFAGVLVYKHTKAQRRFNNDYAPKIRFLADNPDIKW